MSDKLERCVACGNDFNWLKAKVCCGCKENYERNLNKVKRKLKELEERLEDLEKIKEFKK